MDSVLEAQNRLPAIAPETLWVCALFVVAWAVFELWVRADASAHLYRLTRARDSVPKKEECLSPAEWEDLYRRAERIVEETMASLPAEIRAEAMKLPCLYRQWAWKIRGDDALGIYHGFRPGVISEEGGWIVLFLGDLRDTCEENALDFEEEVRTTYLHELGHHLGLDEKDLEVRGLA